MNFYSGVIISSLVLLNSIPSWATNSFKPAHFVNPFVGTAAVDVKDPVPGGKGGATHPGAVVPFGLVTIGPDTANPETSGYNYLDSAIRHFSFTHLSGPGCANTGEIPFMVSIGTSELLPELTSFNHNNEIATPGFYKVAFENQTVVELTATERTGFARFTFPKAKLGDRIQFFINTNRNGVGASRGTVKYRSSSEYIGQMSGGGFCSSKATYETFFSMEFNKAAVEKKFRNGIGIISFINDGQPLLMKSGVSLVSTDGATKNLKLENSDWNFESIKALAANKWNKALSKIQVQSSDRNQLAVFYTALYHSLLHPNIGSDVDGKYRGFDNKIYINETRPFYVNFSGWDIYRSQVQLLALLFPKEASDMAHSLIRSAEQCGAYPKWSLNNTEASIMVGDPGALIVANIFAFGARNFNHQSALKLMMRTALDPASNCQGKLTRIGIKEIIEHGFLPYTKQHWGSAAVALEFASADYGIGKFAEALGDQRLAKAMLSRSLDWRKYFDPKTKLIRPLMPDRSWLTPFDPNSQKGFVEGNAVQYTWMIPFDITELISRIGGNQETIRRLDNFLSNSNAGQSSPNMYIGNEPSFAVPYIYLWTGTPEKTYSAVHKLLNTQFTNTPNGLSGNDDLGALSSWYVWSAIGLFPVIPGVDELAISLPIFPSVNITLDNGDHILIQALNTDASNRLPRKLTLGNQALLSHSVSLRELRAAKSLILK